MTLHPLISKGSAFALKLVLVPKTKKSCNARLFSLPLEHIDKKCYNKPR